MQRSQNKARRAASKGHPRRKYTHADLDRFVSHYTLRGAKINLETAARVGATYQGLTHWHPRHRNWREKRLAMIKHLAECLGVTEAELTRMISVAYREAMGRFPA